MATPTPWKGAGPVYLRSDPAASSPSAVCPKCRNWSLDRGRRSSFQPSMRVDFYDLAESAEAEQCRYCYAIYHALMAVGANLRLDGYSLITLHARLDEPFYVEWDDANDGRSVVEVYKAPNTTSLLEGLGTAYTLEIDLRSPELFSRIRDWISHCESNHQKCAQAAGEAPKRLVYVGNVHSTHIQLIDSPAEDLRYVALSHCWGLGEKFTTTRDTIELRHANIEWNDLPPTFQDAVTVTRHLGLEYVWIDSLCIIQDDSVDWAIESTKMGSIYQRAFVTVAAASASSDDEGFLHASPGRLFHASQELDMYPFGEQSGVLARKLHDVRSTQFSDPLSSRAWTFQERLLPRRVVSYSSAVTFECRNGGHCECGTGIHPDPFYLAVNLKASNRNYFEREQRAFIDMIESLESHDLKGFHDLWYNQVVEPFTQRSLTREHDLLPAVSALAHKFQSVVLGNTYLAGLWRKDFDRGVWWYPYGSDAPNYKRRGKGSEAVCRTTRDYRAPTWSWASVEGRITHIDFDYETEKERGGHVIQNSRLRIEHVHTEVATANPFGEVAGGWLRVTAPAIPAILCIEQNGAGSKTIRLFGEGEGENPISEQTMYLDTPIEELPVASSPEETTAARTPFGGEWKAETVFSSVKCLLGWESFFEQDLQPCRRIFLILGKSPVYEGCYERLGIVVLVFSNLETGALASWSRDSEPETVTIV